MKAPSLLWLLLAAPRLLGAVNAGADFLRAEIPARSASLAGAFAAFDDDPHALLSNPAALAFASQPTLGATHFSSVGDTNFDQAVLAQPIRLGGRELGLGAWIQHSSTDDFAETDSNGAVKGQVENFDLVTAVTGATRLTRTLGFGLGLKAFNSRLAEYRSRGYAVDLGLQQRLGERWTLAVAFMHLGTQEAFDKQADPLPTLFRLGARHRLVEAPEVRLDLALQLDRPWFTSDPILLAGAVEYWVIQRVAFRLGYRLGADTGNMTLGLGARLKGFELDYAFIPLGDLGLTHRTSLVIELAPFLSALAPPDL